MRGLPPSRYGAAPPECRVGEGVSLEVDRWCHGRVLLVTDPGLQPLAGPLLERLRGAAVQVWDRVTPNPSSASISELADAVRGDPPDHVVAFGGGSVLDTAKALTLLLAAGGRMEDHAGHHHQPLRTLPVVAIPTTAGTGSEMQSFALISREDGTKMACGHPAMMPRVVLLDPRWPRSCPPRVATEAWLDAVVHALETAVCSVRTEASRGCAVAALQELVGGEPLLGAAMAGAAIEASMLGAAHALGNALTARYHLPHGLAVGLMAPHVIRYNQAVADYSPVARLIGGDVAGWMDTQLRQRGVPTRLSEHGAQIEDIPWLTDAALAQWTGRFNPRPLTPDAARALYIAAL